MKQPRRVEAPEFRIPAVHGGTVAGRTHEGQLALCISWGASATEVLLSPQESAALRNQLSRFGDWARLRTKRAEDASQP